MYFLRQFNQGIITATVIGFFCLTGAGCQAAAADQPAGNTAGALFTHKEMVFSSQRTYEITLGGTVDGSNTFQRKSGPGFIHENIAPSFQPNIALTIENLSQVQIVNPSITINGKGSLQSIDNILAQVIQPQMTDEEKALAIWVFVKENRYHFYPAESGDEMHTPEKFLSVYGYGLCDDAANTLAILWQHAGLKTRRWGLGNHVVSEVFYDGGFHMLDADTETFYLKEDNKTIASVEEVTRKPFLILRTHHMGAFSNWNEAVNASLAATYQSDDNVQTPDYDVVYDNGESDVENVIQGHKLSMILRPGESFTWRWDNVGKYHNNFQSNQDAPPYFGNSQMAYKPNLENNLFRRFLDAENNMATQMEDGQMPYFHLRPAKPGSEPRQGYFIVKMDMPYVLVGGKITTEYVRDNPGDEITLSISEDGINWKPLWSAQRIGGGLGQVALDDWVAPTASPAKYRFYIRFDFISNGEGAALGLNALTIETVVQHSPMTLPALELGKNLVEYRDDTPGNHPILITHQWQENHSLHPPVPPSRPLYPPDNSQLNENISGFSWEKSNAPDGEVVTGYHFMLSQYPDFRWPYSPNFDRFVPDNHLKTQHGRAICGGCDLLLARASSQLKGGLEPMEQHLALYSAFPSRTRRLAHGH